MEGETLIAIAMAALSLLGTIITSLLAFKEKSNSTVFGAAEVLRKELREDNEKLTARVKSLEEQQDVFKGKISSVEQMLDYIANRVDVLLNKLREGEYEDPPFSEMRDILVEIQGKIAEFQNRE